MTAPSQVSAPTLSGGSLQYDLRTLFASVVLVAALCAVGIYAGKAVTAAVVGMAVISGTTWAAVTTRQWGFLRGAAYGFHLSLLALLVITAHCFYKEYARGRHRPAPAPTTMRRTPAEMLQAIQSEVPSARGISQDARIEDVLCGHYCKNYGLCGSEVYVFPDKTYVYVEWADILPTTIFDEGTWDYRDGAVSMRTDGSNPLDARRFNDRHLSLMAIIQEPFNPTNVKKDYVLLLPAERHTELCLEAAVGRGDVDEFLSMRCLPQAEKISAGETKAIKDWLHANYPRYAPRLRTAASYSKAFLLILAISVVLEFVLRRRRRRFPTTRPPGATVLEQPSDDR